MAKNLKKVIAAAVSLGGLAGAVVLYLKGNQTIGAEDMITDPSFHGIVLSELSNMAKELSSKCRVFLDESGFLNLIYPSNSGRQFDTAVFDLDKDHKLVCRTAIFKYPNERHSHAYKFMENVNKRFQFK